MTSFIFTIVGISLSGVMAPGPITAATLAAGERNRHAGAWICGGHIAVELPLILLLAAGLGTFLESKRICAGIGLVGGLMLLLMGLQLLASLRKLGNGSVASVERHPFLDRRRPERSQSLLHPLVTDGWPDADEPSDGVRHPGPGPHCPRSLALRPDAAGFAEKVVYDVAIAMSV